MTYSAWDKARPSKFGQWVFEQTKGHWRSHASGALDPKEREAVLRQGALDHNEIDQLKIKHRNELIGTPSDYMPLSFDGDGKPSLIASRLTYDGEPFRCRPDLVLEHSSKQHIIIVERKTTRQQRYINTKEGWENIEAQLWCYAHINAWANVENITLIGEIWYGFGCTTIDPFVWRKGELEHHRRCKRHFYRYGGTYRL
jgi:hypothetical protein